MFFMIKIFKQIFNIMYTYSKHIIRKVDKKILTKSLVAIFCSLFMEERLQTSCLKSV